MYIKANLASGIGQLDPIPKIPTSNQPLTAGGATSFNSVAGGIASILSPLVNAGVSVYLTKAQLDAQEKLLKLQQQQQPQIVYTPPIQNQNTVLIAVVGGIAVLLLIVLMGKKTAEAGPVFSGVPGQKVTKIVRRIKKPK